MDIEKLRSFRSNLRALEREIYLDLSSQSECCGVTPAQCHLLLEVEGNPGASLIDLSRSLCLDPSSLSRTVEGLRKKGFLECPRDDADRRLLRMSLTDSGKRLADSINTMCDDQYAGLLSGLKAEEVDTLFKGANSITALLRRARAERQKDTAA
jgi:DNA-binding MarR family transcriptional regulator